MPNIKSAKKRMRQTVKKTARNRIRKEKLRKAVKAFRNVASSSDNAVVGEELKKAVRAIDKANTKGIIHKNTASRRKSRLAKAANRAVAAKA